MNKDMLLFLLIFTLTCIMAHADQIVLKNGDRLTGTIIRVADESIEFESNLIGVVHAPLTAIETIVSDTAAVGFRPTRARGIRFRIGNAAVPAASQTEIRSGFGARWTATIDAALSLTDGNADTRSVNVGTQTARTTERDRTSLYFTSLFANNSTSGESVTTANAIRGGGRYEIDLKPRLFTFGFSDLEFDRFQDLDLRLVLGGGFGLKLLEGPRHEFQVFAGGSSNQEYFGSGLRRKSGESVAGEEWTYRITDDTSFTERLAVYSNLSDLGEYRMTFDSTATTRLNDWLSWQATLSDRYLSNPRVGKRPNDLLFTTGIRINLGDGNTATAGPSSIALR